MSRKCKSMSRKCTYKSRRGNYILEVIMPTSSRGWGHFLYIYFTFWVRCKGEGDRWQGGRRGGPTGALGAMGALGALGSPWSPGEPLEPWGALGAHGSPGGPLEPLEPWGALGSPGSPCKIVLFAIRRARKCKIAYIYCAFCNLDS